MKYKDYRKWELCFTFISKSRKVVAGCVWNHLTVYFLQCEYMYIYIFKPVFIQRALRAMLFSRHVLITFTQLHIDTWKLLSTTTVWSAGHRAAPVEQSGFRVLLKGTSLVVMREGKALSFTFHSQTCPAGPGGPSTPVALTFKPPPPTHAHIEMMMLKQPSALMSDFDLLLKRHEAYWIFKDFTDFCLWGVWMNVMLGYRLFCNFLMW